MGELFSEGRFCAWKQIEIKIIHSDEKIFTSPFSSLFPLSIFSSSSWIYILKNFSKAGNVVASWWKPPKSSALNDQEPPFLHQDWGFPYLKMKCLALHDFTIFLKIICFLLQTHIYVPKYKWDLSPGSVRTEVKTNNLTEKVKVDCLLQYVAICCK